MYESTFFIPGISEKEALLVINYRHVQLDAAVIRRNVPANKEGIHTLLLTTSHICLAPRQDFTPLGCGKSDDPE